MPWPLVGHALNMVTATICTFCVHAYASMGMDVYAKAGIQDSIIFNQPIKMGPRFHGVLVSSNLSGFFWHVKCPVG